jgi:hypothetical protein
MESRRFRNVDGFFKVIIDERVFAGGSGPCPPAAPFTDKNALLALFAPRRLAVGLQLSVLFRFVGRLRLCLCVSGRVPDDDSGGCSYARGAGKVSSRNVCMGEKRDLICISSGSRGIGSEELWTRDWRRRTKRE